MTVACFVDANEPMAVIAEGMLQPGDPALIIHRDPDVKPESLPEVLLGATIAVIDHTYFPTDIAKKCTGLQHVVFLGTGPRSYMNVEELADLGITVHIIKGYGDTAVAECSIALMWASARNIAMMDREMRAGTWLREDNVQLTGKTLGVIGFGGIGAEVARIAGGGGMKVLAWNRTPKTSPHATFVPIEKLLAESDVVSMNLTLNDETRGFLSRERIMAMKPGVLFVNTARAGLTDEDALCDALESGHIRHAGLDVFMVEPLPDDHRLKKIRNVTLSAHAAFRTPEASDNLIAAALVHCRRIAKEGK